MNRFTVVYADVFRPEDMQLICKHNFPSMPDDLVATIIRFVSVLEDQIVHRRKFGSQGGPWEFNLRDILRWLQLLDSPSSAPILAGAKPADLLNLIFRQRFRTPKDRLELDTLFAQVFSSVVPSRHFFHNLSASAYQVGLAYLPRDPLIQRLPYPNIDPLNRLAEIESVMICVQQNIPCILVGPSGSGKSTILEHIAAVSGKSLVVFPLNADVDTMDLVGGFEQVDPQRAASAFLEELRTFMSSKLLASLPAEVPGEALALPQMLQGPSSKGLFVSLAQSLQSLHSKTSIQEFGDLAATCQHFADTPMNLENARFEWVDGVLVKALEEGKWLVLDNANLCSASVLDRLNSLLEPNGFLSINEHHGSDGEPKIVNPHPDFRIFLTTDPRFGELSRAMRNRAIEIFLDPPALSAMDIFPTISRPEASMQRFENILKSLKDASPSKLMQSVAMDNLSWADMQMVSSFAKLTKQIFPSQYQELDLANLQQAYLDIYLGVDNRNLRSGIGNALETLAAKSGLVPADFRDAQVSDRAVLFRYHRTDSYNEIRLSIRFKTRLCCFYLITTSSRLRYSG